MAGKFGNVSEEGVRKGTGRGWKDWIELLDDAGAEQMSHGEIAAMLIDRGFLGKDDRWWAQTVTVGYEHAKGRRVKGQTADAGFEVGVQKTIAVSAPALWQFLTSVDGLQLWLGEVDEPIVLQKGAAYHTKNGTTGEVRSIYPEEKLRLTWKPARWPNQSTLQLYLQAKGEKTALRFHQEKLQDEDQRAEMKAHWKGVLAAIARAV